MKNIVHIRHNGRSWDVEADRLQIHEGLGDAQIRERVARYLEIDVAEARELVVDRVDNGNVIVRPHAVYG